MNSGPVPLEEMGEAELERLATVTYQDGVEGVYAYADSPVADAVDGLNLEREDPIHPVPRRTPGSVRKEAWDLLAESAGVATASAGTLRPVAGQLLFKTVHAHPGGAAALCRDWLAGDTTEAQDDVLFAPFEPGMTMKEQQAVVELLLAHPAHTGVLWDSALAIATQGAGPKLAATPGG